MVFTDGLHGFRHLGWVEVGDGPDQASDDGMRGCCDWFICSCSSQPRSVGVDGAHVAIRVMTLEVDDGCLIMAMPFSPPVDAFPTSSPSTSICPPALHCIWV